MAAAVGLGFWPACNVDKQYNWITAGLTIRCSKTQKLNPDAGDDAPVAGINGRAAVAAQKRYEKPSRRSRRKRRRCSSSSATSDKQSATRAGTS
jgi:hypothetical protein